MLHVHVALEKGVVEIQRDSWRILGQLLPTSCECFVVENDIHALWDYSQRPLECDGERKLTIARGSLRNHNRRGVLFNLGCPTLSRSANRQPITLRLSWTYVQTDSAICQSFDEEKKYSLA